MDDIKKIRQLPLLFVFCAGVIGAQLWSYAATEREQAALVQPEPQSITAAELTANQPLENRYVSIFECWFGEGLAYCMKRGGQEIQYVYIPVYPADVEQETTGDNIRLLACFTNVRNVNELKEAMQADELTGFIWDNKQIFDDVKKNLVENYPQIDLQHCRVVNIGQSYPTVAQADQYFLMSYGTFAFGLVLAAWYFARNIQRWLGLANDREISVPHAEQSPRQDVPRLLES